jgi:hypothetical protein
MDPGCQRLSAMYFVYPGIIFQGPFSTPVLEAQGRASNAPA